MKYYDKLIFDLSKEGRQGYSLPSRKWNAVLADLPAGYGVSDAGHAA